MQVVSISEFIAHLITYFNKVKRGEELIVTSRGHEVACITPPKEKLVHAKQALKQLRKKCYVGDVLSALNEDLKSL